MMAQRQTQPVRSCLGRACRDRALRPIALLAAAGSVHAQPFDPLQVRAGPRPAPAATPARGAPVRHAPLVRAGREAMAAALLDFKSGLPGPPPSCSSKPWLR